jgi:hypothetical protein
VRVVELHVKDVNEVVQTVFSGLEQHHLGYVVAVPKSQQIKSLAGVQRIDKLIAEAPAGV